MKTSEGRFVSPFVNKYFSTNISTIFSTYMFSKFAQSVNKMTRNDLKKKISFLFAEI